MKILGIVAVILGWVFFSLILWDIFYESGFRDTITIMVCSIGWVLLTILGVALVIVVHKEK